MANITEQDFTDLLQLGLKPIPLKWDIASKTVKSHCIAHSEITADNYNIDNFKTKVKSLQGVNGIGIKLFSPFGCVDFDLKNTEDKEVFTKWLKAVTSLDDEILSKICIETTRNAGFHVYIKYQGLKNKVSLAREKNGDEVIAIYTGGTLSYCDPTPGYEMYHNEWQDLQELTDDQFDVLVSTAVSFDKYESKNGGASKTILSAYPKDYESTCIQFDEGITEEAFELILNDMGLFFNPEYKNSPKDPWFKAYLRKGSKAKMSAKVYFKSKKVLIFSGSIQGYPHWADRVDADDHSWVLTPSKLIYYKNDKDWASTIEEIKMIGDSIGIEIVDPPEIILHPRPINDTDRLKVPMDIFSHEFQSIAQVTPFPNEMLAGAYLSALSVLIGNSAVFIASDGFFVKPIIFMAVVASPGSFKSPAAKVSLSHLSEIDHEYMNEYLSKNKEYKIELAEYKNQKKGEGIKEPEKPELKQIQIKDATIEMTIKILSTNTHGCINNSDELSGFLKRMNRYGDNDEAQKWLELYDGNPLTLQRIGRELDYVADPFCSIFGTIQPGVLAALSAKDNAHNGFFHRFLFVYPEPEKKLSFNSFTIPQTIKDNFKSLMQNVYKKDGDKSYYRFSEDALVVYQKWFDEKNVKYNAAESDDIKGIISKYQTYCLKFALILEIEHNPLRDKKIISLTSMENAIRLTEYFFANIHKAMKILSPNSPLDRLNDTQMKLYKSLPVSFSNATATEIAKKLNIKEATCRVYLVRWCKDEPILTSKGDQRNKTYSKIYE
ncbi:DUF3987 domain-containing protein [Pedobacter cryotolerans]|uniref:DUF3987 domain-containing protein n=1 Tax=Pedobacter cryotolerans TaxID=2571270 RepID=A0A4V6WMZ8_9SPHI|nr:DUF3987 domain-containing protein [Pedobacter cryotolerans]TKC01243.1 DUF3987 domain-containing protein [Pedobacter cryotolerans]